MFSYISPCVYLLPAKDEMLVFADSQGMRITVQHMKTRPVERGLWTLAVIMVAFWTAWFAHRSLVASSTSYYYVAFENAFPVADGLLTAAVVAGAVALRRQHATALLWLLLGAGAGIYLAGMDILFDVEHQIWWTKGAGGWIELAINIITVSASVSLTHWTWQHRGELLGE